MNIEDKLAKPDKTIGQHSNELIEQENCSISSAI